MTLSTTCVGAFPKPDYLPIRDWFQVDHGEENYIDEVIRVEAPSSTYFR